MSQEIKACPLFFALIGGATATVLWEITRSILVWYHAHLSLVNLIYGSIATVVVALLSVEAVASIILLGAQVRNGQGVIR